MKYQKEAPAADRPAHSRPQSQTTPGQTTPRDVLIARITDVAPAVRRLFQIRPDPGERGAWMQLTSHQLEALTVLSAGSVTMGELCDRLDISESAGTALSDRLVGHGMAVREADPSDRRIVRLALSDEARSMVDRFRALKRTRIAEVLAVLDDDELEALAQVYERLVSDGPCGDGPGRSDEPLDSGEHEQIDPGEDEVRRR